MGNIKLRTGICPLLDKETEIRESHIFPKFVYKSLKWNNNSKFVTRQVRCVPKQDGLKRYLLGKEAEIIFSQYENWFARYIYKPFRNGELNGVVEYDEHLYYFLVLQIWRSCLFVTNEYEKDTFADGLYETILLAMSEWKQYLVNKTLPQNYYNFYLMPIETNLIHIPRFLETEFYIRRNIEFNIMDSDTQKAVYCKLPSFIIWAPLCHDSNINYGFNIEPNGGSFDLSDYSITDIDIIDYLVYKVNQTVEWRKQMALLNPQKIKNNQAKMAKDKDFQDSELAEILSMPSLSEMQLSGEDYTMSFIL